MPHAATGCLVSIPACAFRGSLQGNYIGGIAAYSTNNTVVKQSYAYWSGTGVHSSGFLGGSDGTQDSLYNSYTYLHDIAITNQIRSYAYASQVFANTGDGFTLVDDMNTAALSIVVDGAQPFVQNTPTPKLWWE